ncbi:hypothetical protein Tco_0134005, partial [Tanacetum coccineum]
YLNQLQAQAQAISSQITSTGEAGNTQTESGQILLDFDLNEVPAIMMEDEGGDANAHVNGNGYSSSSYNSNIELMMTCMGLLKNSKNALFVGICDMM